jgi:hypothetical protein
MGRAGFSKQLDLADFFGKVKSDFVIGKYMFAVVSGHFIQGSTASLG